MKNELPTDELKQKKQEAWVDQILTNMTLREKIGQTVQETIMRVPVQKFTPDEIKSYLDTYPIGSLFIRASNAKSARNVLFNGFGDVPGDYQRNLQTFQAASKIPLLVSGDLEAGAGGVVPGLTHFPGNMSVGAANDENLAFEMGRHTGLQSRAAGFTWNLAPVADLAINWLNPAVGTRALGDDPRRVAKLAVALTRGMESQGLAATAKHFPGDGVDFRDQHICTTVNSLSEEEWFEQSGYVFQQMIDAGVNTMMIGHIALPWVEPFDKQRQKYRPATVSRRICTELLRERMGFKGVIISDALDMAAYTNWDSYENCMIDSFNAGIDVMLWPGSQYFDLIERAVEDGRIPESRVNESARRVLEMKSRLDLHELGEDGADPRAVPLVNSRLSPELVEEAETASRSIGEQSVTLVRDRNNLLPLNAKTLNKILVAKLNHVTDDRSFPDADLFIERLRERGMEVEVVDMFEPINIFHIMETQEGGRWDAFLVLFLMPWHGLVNNVRPVGDAAKGLWALQSIKTVEPIYVSLATPFLLHDIPFAETLINAYSCSPATLDMVDRAIFGEIPFGTKSPVKTGGWE